MSDTPMTVEQVILNLANNFEPFFLNNDRVIIKSGNESYHTDKAIAAINAIRRADMEAVIGSDEDESTLSSAMPPYEAMVINNLKASQRTRMKERLK